MDTPWGGTCARIAWVTALILLGGAVAVESEGDWDADLLAVWTLNIVVESRRSFSREEVLWPSYSGRVVMFNNLGNLADLMRNAGKIQEAVKNATESLGQVQVEGAAGGGAVEVKANGRLELVSVRIDPKLLADGDAELLEDLVLSAANQALVRAREAAAKSLSSVAGGLPLQGLSGLFGGGGGGAVGGGGGEA